MPADRYTTGIRQYGRVLVDAPVRVFATPRAPTFGRMHDIGCGGMSFHAPAELLVNDVIKLEFELPYSRMGFGISATVRNRNGFRYGVAFQNLTPDEFGEIARVTATLSVSQP
jgi:hypothetical protein